jgi:hypothetical protein
LERSLFKRHLHHRISARWHMSLICAATIAGGILFSKAALLLGLSVPAFRYGLAVAFSYGVFFLLVYLWLRWHFELSAANEKPRSGSSLDAVDPIDAPGGLSLPSGGQSLPQWGEGGRFSGAGASSSWGPGEKSIPSGSSSKASVFDSLGDSDEAAVILLLVAAVLVVSGSAFYIVYQAPEILFEAAFEAVLVAGLVKRSKEVAAEGWARAIFKRTWFLFLGVLVVMMIFGFVIRHQCPGASSFADYRKLCYYPK